MTLAPTLMLQGTSSHVGKSTLVTALCRAFRQDGLRVAPFKAQNMALNSYVTADGREVGRAQASQAAAAGIDLSVDMNPILLKPQSDRRSQVIVLGRPLSTMEAADYYREKVRLLPLVLDALERLRRAYDLVIIEGAGSPAEINLRASDIVNMRIARETMSPVLLVGDINLGGVFAALVGTLALVRPEERDLVVGFLINKFRGDVELLRPGLTFLERYTNKKVYGVLPYLRDIGMAEEDSVALDRPNERATPNDNGADIAVIQLDHISNFDDIDALRQDADLRVRFVRSLAELGEPDAIVLPGTKSTVADLERLRQSGLARAIVQRRRTGTLIIGICGGYQMLGTAIHDPHGVESSVTTIEGLGLLRVETTFVPRKATYRVDVVPASPHPATAGLSRSGFAGYEVHMGQTTGPDATPPLLTLRRADGGELPDGAASPDGRVVGHYIHGCFDQIAGRAWFRSLVPHLHGSGSSMSLHDVREQAYDRLAATVRANTDWDAIRALVGR